MKKVYTLSIYQKCLTYDKEANMIYRWFRIRKLFYFNKRDAFKAFRTDYPQGYKVVLRMRKK